MTLCQSSEINPEWYDAQWKHDGLHDALVPYLQLPLSIFLLFQCHGLRAEFLSYRELPFQLFLAVPLTYPSPSVLLTCADFPSNTT